MFRPRIFCLLYTSYFIYFHSHKNSAQIGYVDVAVTFSVCGVVSLFVSVYSGVVVLFFFVSVCDTDRQIELVIILQLDGN